MTLNDFIAVLTDFHGDLDLMVRGHPFSTEEISDALYETEDEAQRIVLTKMLDAASH